MKIKWQRFEQMCTNLLCSNWFFLKCNRFQQAYMKNGTTWYLDLGEMEKWRCLSQLGHGFLISDYKLWTKLFLKNTSMWRDFTYWIRLIILYRCIGSTYIRPTSPLFIIISLGSIKSKLICLYINLESIFK